MDFKKRTNVGIPPVRAASFQPGTHELFVEKPAAAASKCPKLALPLLIRVEQNCGAQAAAGIRDALLYLKRSRKWDKGDLLIIANHLAETAEHGADVNAATVPLRLLRNSPRNAKLVSMLLANSAIFSNDFDFGALSKFFTHFAQEKNPPDFARSFLVGIHNINFPKDCYDTFELYGLAKQYWELLGGTYYAHKLISESLGNLRPPDSKINRIPFQKTGSTLIPLGGKLTGYLFRIIPKKAFDAWNRARQAGVPCE